MIISAVIVTHNRKKLLNECLKAILKQTLQPNKIIIINNASTDGTLDLLKTKGWLDHEKVSVISLEKNTGGAGGFYTGIKEAHKNGAKWIWVMDDDCIPNKDALEELMAANSSIQNNTKSEPGFISSRVLWVDQTPCTMNLPTPHQLWIEPHSYNSSIHRINSASFVSMLINRDAIDEVGLPIRQFFIWFDDVEFSRRASGKFSCYLASRSTVIHKTPENRGAMDFNAVSTKNLWKYKYGARNECSYWFSQGVYGGIIYVAKILIHLKRSSAPPSIKTKIVIALFSGLFFKHKKMIEKP